ncbi:hypothetical protein BDR22DRAFT_893643 [Usnea florida]
MRFQIRANKRPPLHRTRQSPILTLICARSGEYPRETRVRVDKRTLISELLHPRFIRRRAPDYSLISHLKSPTMQRWTSLLTVSILPALALSITLPPLQDTNNTSQPPTLSPSLFSAENTSTTYTNTSLGKILKINCDPVRYGRNLKVSSCKNVFTYLAPNDTQTVFAERGSVQPHDVNLPYRITSSKPHILKTNSRPLLAHRMPETFTITSHQAPQKTHAATSSPSSPQAPQPGAPLPKRSSTPPAPSTSTACCHSA